MSFNTIYHGLNDRAIEFLRIIPIISVSVYNHAYGKDGQAYSLRKYTLSSGTILIESIQCQPWFNCFENVFVALKDCEDNWIVETPWTELEIKEIISQ
jgi:hypothetical protein